VAWTLSPTVLGSNPAVLDVPNCSLTASVFISPIFSQLVYLKVASLLFPTSDYRHSVTTPALLYICQSLSKVGLAAFPSLTIRHRFAAVQIDLVACDRYIVIPSHVLQ